MFCYLIEIKIIQTHTSNAKITHKHTHPHTNTDHSYTYLEKHLFVLLGVDMICVGLFGVEVFPNNSLNKKRLFCSTYKL